MRWRFPDPAQEQARRQVVARIDAFWKLFRERLAGEIEADLAAKRAPAAEQFGEHLRVIDPALRWEIGQETNGRLYLALTPESQRHLRPLIERVIERAPALAGWVYRSARPPKPLDEAAQYTRQIMQRSLDGWVCNVSLGEHNLIVVRYGIPGCRGPKDREAHISAMATTDALVGEALFERWVGAVEIRPIEEVADGEPLDGLHTRVDALRAQVIAGLPGKPLYTAVNEATWALYKFNPRRRSDYRGRQDLYVGKTLAPALWQCAHAGVIFCSERFSRVGETFCYLKLDGEEGFGERGFEDKSEAEDALDEALGEAKLGCVIGGGSGLRYNYIDLALLDVTAGFEVVKRVMREGKAPRRTWLQFFDDDLATEWLGLSPKSPAPPGAT